MWLWLCMAIAVVALMSVFGNPRVASQWFAVVVLWALIYEILRWVSGRW